MKRSARVGVPQYTYRQANTQEKLIYRRLAIIGGLTLVLLVTVWLWGLTFVRIIGGLGTKNVDDESTQTDIDLPLLKPTLYDIPEFTNQDKITISGSTTTNASVTLTVNGTQVSKTVADSGGNFSFVDITLKEKLNLIKVVASNKAGDSREESAVITLDKQPPDLQISSPTDGQSLPKDTKNVAIKGTTEPDATVLINSIQTTLDQGGNFTYVYQLSPGENKIEVKSTDRAGNIKVVQLTVTVQT